MCKKDLYLDMLNRIVALKAENLKLFNSVKLKLEKLLYFNESIEIVPDSLCKIYNSKKIRIALVG